jgi:hypothetical protein
MEKTTIFAVVHNYESKKWFIELNNTEPIFKDIIFLAAGDGIFEITIIERLTDVHNIQHHLRCLDDNIEQYKSLLAFTAWYAVSKNHLCNSPYVGIFEYDTGLNFRGDFSLDKKTIIGFNPRGVAGDSYYLSATPGLIDVISKKYYINAMKQPLWNATTNLIMPIEFLHKFVNWYTKLIPAIFEYKNHPHFHERAVNIFAANNGYKFRYEPNLCRHLQLKSHGIELM